MTDPTKPFIPWKQNGWHHPGMVGYDDRLVLVLPLYMQSVRLDGLALSAWFLCPFCGHKQRKLVMRVFANQASCKNKACRSVWRRDGHARLWLHSDAAVSYFRMSGEVPPAVVREVLDSQNTPRRQDEALPYVLPQQIAMLMADPDPNTLSERSVANVATMPTRMREGWATTVNQKTFIFSDEMDAWHWLCNKLERKGYGKRGAKET